ncbi:MAG: heme exporter protein CcmD [Acidimicrobiales bacterium]
MSGEFWGFVVAGYGVTVAAIGGYAVWVLRRGRRLSKLVPPEERRWTST